MLIALTSDEWQVLKEVVTESGRGVQPMLSCDQGMLEVNDDAADEYRNLIQDEYEVRGLNENYEPTPRGKILESLIDKLFTG